MSHALILTSKLISLCSDGQRHFALYELKKCYENKKMYYTIIKKTNIEFKMKLFLLFLMLYTSVFIFKVVLAHLPVLRVLDGFTFLSNNMQTEKFLHLIYFQLFISIKLFFDRPQMLKWSNCLRDVVVKNTKIAFFLSTVIKVT